MNILKFEINGFTVIPDKDHFMIYKNGIFIESCDTGELTETMNRLSYKNDRSIEGVLI